MLLAALHYLLIRLTLLFAITCAALTNHFSTTLEVTEGYIMFLTTLTFLGPIIVSGCLGAIYISSLD